MRTALDQSRINRGFAALAILLAFALAAAGAIVLAGLSSFPAPFSPQVLDILRFTLLQAGLSLILSVALAIPVAFALDQLHDFSGRKWVAGLFALPLSLPAIVAVMALLSLFGRNGMLAQSFSWLGGPAMPNIYGLAGVLLAHVFFNLPLAARLFLNALDTIPQAHWKLAESLRFSARDRFLRLCWPAMRTALPGIAGLIFLLCLTSFSIVLVLGGGPAATTLEVAIYQALTYDIDLGKAAVLTLLQLGIVLVVLLTFSRFGVHKADLRAHAMQGRRYARLTRFERFAAMAVVLLAVMFVGAPLAAVGIDGITADHGRILTSRSFIAALETSFGFAFLSAVIATVLALMLAAALYAAAATGSPLLALLNVAPSVVLALPPIMLGAGWFILISGFGDPFQFAAPVVIAVNAAMALPFAVRILEPQFNAAANRHDRLCGSLRLSGWARLRLVDFPALRRPLAIAFFFAMALSFGDLGVIALFGSDGMLTLPSLILAKMGAYRMNDAAGIALYLMLLSMSLSLTAHKLSGTAANG